MAAKGCDFSEIARAEDQDELRLATRGRQIEGGQPRQARRQVPFFGSRTSHMDTSARCQKR